MRRSCGDRACVRFRLGRGSIAPFTRSASPQAGVLIMAVQRATAAQFERCVKVFRSTSTEDPFVKWLRSTSEESAHWYFRYALHEGLGAGNVFLGDPQTGICIATPVRSTPSYSVRSILALWCWTRLHLSITFKQWQTLRRVSKSVHTSCDSSGVMIWYVGVARRFRGTGLAAALLEAVLEASASPPQDRDCVPVFLQTARPSVKHFLRRAGAKKLSQTLLSSDRLPLGLFEISTADFRAAIHSTSRGERNDWSV